MTRLTRRFVVVTALAAVIGLTTITSAQQTPAPAVVSPEVTAALQRGEVALSQGQYEAALDAFTFALQRQGRTSATILFGMARAFQGLAAWRSAADSATDGLKYVGSDKKLEAQLHNQRGLAFLELSAKPGDQMMRDAEAEFRTALTLTELVPDAWFNLGTFLLRQNRDPEGVAALQAFVDSGVKSPDVENAKRMIEDPRRAREVFAPEFDVTSTDGERFALKDLRGKVVLLDFWATWCGPCVRATPMLIDLKKARAKDPRFILLSITGEPASEAGKIRDFATMHKFAWPMIHDASRALSAKYRVIGIPMYLVIDGDGIIRERVVGYGAPTRGRLDQAITRALRAMDNRK
jgi:thiol-disulfide isomerase/thioredoxin